MVLKICFYSLERCTTRVDRDLSRFDVREYEIIVIAADSAYEKSRTVRERWSLNEGSSARAVVKPLIPQPEVLRYRRVCNHGWNFDSSKMTLEHCTLHPRDTSPARSCSRVRSLNRYRSSVSPVPAITSSGGRLIARTQNLTRNLVRRRTVIERDNRLLGGVQVFVIGYLIALPFRSVIARGG